MANRYWVGNGGSWSDTAHWSTTSGGSGGASVPTFTSSGGYFYGLDDVVFDENSFTTTGQTVSCSSSIFAKTFTSANCAYNPTLALTTGSLFRHYMSGNTDYSGVTLTFASGAQKVFFNGAGSVLIKTGANTFKSMEFQSPQGDSVFTVQGTPTVIAVTTFAPVNALSIVMTGSTLTTGNLIIGELLPSDLTGGTVNISASLQVNGNVFTSTGTTWNILSGATVYNSSGSASLVVGTGGTVSIDTATVTGINSSTPLTITNNSGTTQTISNSTLTNTVLNGSSPFNMVEIIDGGGNDWGDGGGGTGNPTRLYHVKIPPTYVALP